MKSCIYKLVFLIVILTFPPAPNLVFPQRNLRWTEDELNFIKTNPIIHLGVDPKFIPFEFIDAEGEYQGIAKDYLDLVSEISSLQFEIQKGLTWSQAYELALNGDLDGLPFVGKTPEREEQFLFSDAYYDFKRVIVIKNSNTGISCIDDLENRSVAVQRNSSHHSYLLTFKNIHLSLYDSVEAALLAINTGEEIAFIGNLATTNYLVRACGITDLKLVSFEAEKSQSLYFAARKDWPQLISIFNKAVAAITEQEKAAIRNKWIVLDTKFDNTLIIRIIIIVVTVFAAVITVSLFWIIKLKNEITKRIKLQKLLEESKLEVDQINQQLKVVNKELEKLSMVDGLTGLSNRRYFDEFVTNLWGINTREKKPLSVFMIDIDNFKAFNDSHGHLAGDICLRTVARIIKSSVKRSGDVAARFGGEEFIIWLSNTKKADSLSFAEKLRQTVEETKIEFEGKQASVTVSIGVTSKIAANDYSPQDLIKEADAALYEAKSRGKNQVIHAEFAIFFQ